MKGNLGQALICHDDESPLGRCYILVQVQYMYTTGCHPVGGWCDTFNESAGIVLGNDMWFLPPFFLFFSFLFLFVQICIEVKKAMKGVLHIWT